MMQKIKNFDLESLADDQYVKIVKTLTNSLICLQNKQLKNLTNL